jgi:hypothetical protein
MQIKTLHLMAVLTVVMACGILVGYLAHSADSSNQAPRLPARHTAVNESLIELTVSMYTMLATIAASIQVERHASALGPQQA